MEQTRAVGTSAVVTTAGTEKERRHDLRDALVVVVLVLVLLPAVLVASAAPVVAAVVAVGLGVLALRWPVDAGPVPRIVTGLVAVVALIAAVLGLLA